VHPGYFPVFFWSLVIFASFWGYGELLRRRIDRPEFADLGWGLTAAWGMSVVLAIGGILMVLHLAKAPVLTAVVLTGAAAAIYFAAGKVTSRDTKPAKGKSGAPKSKIQNPKSESSGFKFQVSGFRLADILLYLLAALSFASSIAWPHHIDPNDDLVCYLMLPEKILATGTLIEPFSFQRAGTFGGQAILQALVMIVGGERNGHVPDRGFAMVILFGIFLHATRGLNKQQGLVRLLLLFTFLFVPVPRISTNGAMVGGCLLVGMLATLDLALVDKARPWRAFIPVGLLAAGSCSIRPTFTFVVGSILAALALREMLGALKAKGSLLRAFRPYLAAGLTCFVVLLPFMVVLFLSNGTPMVPPISGFVSKAYQTYSFNSPGQDLLGVLAFCKVPETLCMITLLAVAAIFRSRDGTVWIVIASLLACFVILYRFSALAYLDQYRYIYPILVPMGLWLLCGLLQITGQNESGGGTPLMANPLLPVAACASVLIALVAVNAAQGWRELRVQVAGLPEQVREVKPFFDPNLKKAYAALQDLVPPGETILSMVDASYWLDYKRNTIYGINAVGGASPPPGIPFEQGPGALANYLKSLGIRYVIAVDFDNAVLLYTRKLWTERTRPEWFYPQIWRPRFLDFMSNIDALERSGGGVARAANARLIDLGRCQ